MILIVIVIVVVVQDLVLDLHAVVLVDHLLVLPVEVLVVHVRDPRLLLLIVRNMVLVQSHLVVVMILAVQKEVVPEVVNVFVMMTSKSVQSFVIYCIYAKYYY
jgi:hypothetical protein